WVLHALFLPAVLLPGLGAGLCPYLLPALWGATGQSVRQRGELVSPPLQLGVLLQWLPSRASLGPEGPLDAHARRACRDSAADAGEPHAFPAWAAHHDPAGRWPDPEAEQIPRSLRRKERPVPHRDGTLVMRHKHLAVSPVELMEGAETAPSSNRVLHHAPEAFANQLSLSRFMIYDAPEARWPPRWRVDSALACRPARVPGDHQCDRGRGAAPCPIL